MDWPPDSPRQQLKTHWLYLELSYFWSLKLGRTSCNKRLVYILASLDYNHQTLKRSKILWTLLGFYCELFKPSHPKEPNKLHPQQWWFLSSQLVSLIFYSIDTLGNREHIVLSFKCKSESRGSFFPFILGGQFSPSYGKNCKIYKIDECLKLTNVTDPVGSSSLVGNSHYRAFVTNANAKCIELGQPVRHCRPKEIHLQFHALFCQDMYLSFHSPVPIPSSVRTHEQGKVSVHSGLSSMLNDKKSWCFWGCTWCSTFCTYIIGVIYCRPRFLWFRSHILDVLSANLQGSEVHWEPVWASP